MLLLKWYFKNLCHFFFSSDPLTHECFDFTLLTRPTVYKHAVKLSLIVFIHPLMQSEDYKRCTYVLNAATIVLKYCATKMAVPIILFQYLRLYDFIDLCIIHMEL